MGNSETNEIYFIMILGTLIMLSLALAFVLFFQWSKRRIFEVQLLQKDLELEHQAELLHRSILVQEEERQRIAKDLHDDIGSKLNVLFLYLTQLERKVEAPKMNETIQDMHELINVTIASSRRIAHDLLPPTLEKFGLAASLEELCEQYQQEDRLKVDCKINTVDEVNLHDLLALNLFRIIQELFSNTFKYAEAQHVILKADISSTAVVIQYQDDGKGFDMRDATHQKGLGLNNMKNRMQIIGGTYEFISAPNEGVRVTLRVTQDLYAQ
jgi:signal transduction histidine kinase